MIIITDFDDWTEGVIKQYTSISTYILLQPMHDEGLWAIEQKINEKTRKYSGMFSGKKREHQMTKISSRGTPSEATCWPQNVQKCENIPTGRLCTLVLLSPKWIALLRINKVLLCCTVPFLPNELPC